MSETFDPDERFKLDVEPPGEQGFCPGSGKVIHRGSRDGRVFAIAPDIRVVLPPGINRGSGILVALNAPLTPCVE